MSLSSDRGGTGYPDEATWEAVLPWVDLSSGGRLLEFLSSYLGYCQAPSAGLSWTSSSLSCL